MSEWDEKTRFFARTVHLSFVQSLRRWIKSGKWDTEIVEYLPVHPGDPRYKTAPHSARTIYRNK